MKNESATRTRSHAKEELTYEGNTVGKAEASSDLENPGGVAAAKHSQLPSQMQETGTTTHFPSKVRSVGTETEDVHL